MTCAAATSSMKRFLKGENKTNNLNPQTKKILKVLFLSIFMFSVSAVSDNLGKEILNRFDYPLTLTLVHLISASVYPIPLLFFMGLRNVPVDSRQFLYKVLPLSFVKSFSIAAGHFSLWKISVSYSHTIKACLPIFTVVLSVLFFKFRPSARIFCSLVFIVSGVVIASFTETEFSTIGLILGLASTVGQSIQHIVNNGLMRESQIHVFELLSIYGRLSLFIFAPVWLFSDANRVSNFFQNSPMEFSSSFQIPVIPVLLAVDGFLFFLENILAFCILSVVTATSYSVIGTFKKVLVILVSFIWFKTAVTLMNGLGIAVAILGVFLYSYFGIKDKETKGIHTEIVDPDVEKNSPSEDETTSELLQVKSENSELNV